MPIYHANVWFVLNIQYGRDGWKEAGGGFRSRTFGPSVKRSDADGAGHGRGRHQRCGAGDAAWCGISEHRRPLRYPVILSLWRRAMTTRYLRLHLLLYREQRRQPTLARRALTRCPIIVPGAVCLPARTVVIVSGLWNTIALRFVCSRTTRVGRRAEQPAKRGRRRTTTAVTVLPER